MERSPIRDFVVGLFVIAGLTAVVYLSISVGGYTWERNSGLHLAADFDELGGLTERAPVVISGVRVGEVSKITLGANYRARVEMDLDSSLKLPTDTTASIFTSGMLGDRYISLQPGGDDKLLKSGDTIAFTEKAVILERVLGQLVYGITKGDTSDKPSASQAGTAPAAGAPAIKP
jgi:phospholipid/cholesterol/gamma-HCH transport system substrate-binding protein